MYKYLILLFCIYYLYFYNKFLMLNHNSKFSNNKWYICYNDTNNYYSNVMIKNFTCIKI